MAGCLVRIYIDKHLHLDLKHIWSPIFPRSWWNQSPCRYVKTIEELCKLLYKQEFDHLNQCVNTIITFKLIYNNCLSHLKEIFEFAPQCRIDTRNQLAKPKIPFCKTNMGQKAISFVVPSLWNRLPESIKKTNNLNTCKHNVKNYCLDWINNELIKCVSYCHYVKDFILWIYLSILLISL